MIRRGMAFIFGCDLKRQTQPITNLPPDTVKVRLRFRNQSAAIAFVKTPTEVQKWVLGPDGGGAMKLAILQGSNRR